MAFRILVFLTMLLLCCGAATAASFDCDKAQTPFERAICTSPDLSEKDEILAKSYATALGGLSDEAAAEVRRGQRDWLDYAERACTDDAEPMAEGDYSEEGLGCLAAVFQSRIIRLAESRMRDGRRVYSVDRYTVLPDPEADAQSFSKVATKEFNIARIDGRGAEAAAFNALMEEFGTHFDDLIGSGEDGVDPEEDASSDSQVAVTVDNISSRRISLIVNAWWYGHGAAHGNYTITYIHFLTGERREMRADDVLHGDDWHQPLAEMAFAELKRTIEDGPWQESADELIDAVRDPARWNFSEEGLVIRFQPYEVTAYAFGAPTVTIPWDSLGEYMAEKGNEIAYY